MCPVLCYWLPISLLHERTSSSLHAADGATLLIPVARLEGLVALTKAMYCSKLLCPMFARVFFLSWPIPFAPITDAVFD